MEKRSITSSLQREFRRSRPVLARRRLSLTLVVLDAEAKRIEHSS
jgi:hypothetical protein